MPLDAVVLLGWMERDQAVKFLLEDCFFQPPITEVQARELWRPYRERTEVIAEREAAAPTEIPLNKEEVEYAQKFLTFLNSINVREFRRVVKINPMQLVVKQSFVITERSEGYRLRCATDGGWRELALPTSLTFPQLTVNFTQQEFDTSIDIDLPHAEFFFGPNLQGSFQPSQLLPIVTVMNFGARMLLWAGYHRVFARMSNPMPAAAERSALVAVTSNTVLARPVQGVGVGLADAGRVDLSIFGRRPPLFSDFFIDGLFMKVRLKKKRYRLEIRSKMVRLDAENP